MAHKACGFTCQWTDEKLKRARHCQINSVRIKWKKIVCEFAPEWRCNFRIILTLVVKARLMRELRSCAHFRNRIMRELCLSIPRRILSFAILFGNKMNWLANGCVNTRGIKSIAHFASALFHHCFADWPHRFQYNVDSHSRKYEFTNRRY